MSFQFQIEAPATDFRWVETLPKTREKKAGSAPLLLLDQWRCDDHPNSLEFCQFSECDFYFDFSRYRKESDKTKGRFYEQLSEALPDHLKVRREVAVTIFRFSCPKHPFVKDAYLYAPHSPSQRLDLQELTFYEHIAQKIDHLMNFVVEKSFLAGVLLCLVYAWNHGYLHRLLNIEGGVIVPFN